MRFTPLNEDQIQQSGLLKEAQYDFTVINAEEKPSKSKPGNTYIALILQVWDEEGRERLIYTNLALIKLLKHFCDIAGLQDKYEAGEVLADDCLNKGGRVVLGIEKSKINPNGGDYPAKNIVKDYVLKKSHDSMGKKDNNPPDFINDVLPF
jgi:hypothetical protein